MMLDLFAAPDGSDRQPISAEVLASCHYYVPTAKIAPDSKLQFLNLIKSLSFRKRCKIVLCSIRLYRVRL